MDDDVLERDAIGAVHGCHHHARHPQAHDVASRGQHLGGIRLLHLRRVHALLGPAHRGERPQLRREPRVQHVLVLAHGLPAHGARLDVLHRRVLPAALVAVEHGDAVAPPQLARDAPVLEVVQPVEVHLLPALGVELDGAVLHHARRVLLEAVHGHEPLLGLPGLELRVAAVARHDGVVVVLHLLQQAQLVERGHDGFAGLVAVHAAERAEAVHHVRGLVEDIDALEAVALAHRPVVRVVRGRGLHAAGTELPVHVPVGEDGDLAVDERQFHRLAHEVLEALVLRVHRHARVAEHRLGARRGHHEVLQAVLGLGQRVAQVPQVPRLVHVLGLVVGDGRRAVGAPVHDALALVDEVVVVPVHEQLAHGLHVGRLQREVLVGVVARAAHALDLVHDGGAVLLVPVVARLDERLAADFQTADALVGQLLVHLGLRGDAGVVGAEDPARGTALHAGAADARVLDGVVEGVAHVQHARDVRRRDDDGVGLPRARAQLGRALEVARVHPRVEKRALVGGEVVVDLLAALVVRVIGHDLLFRPQSLSNRKAGAPLVRDPPARLPYPAPALRALQACRIARRKSFRPVRRLDVGLCLPRDVRRTDGHRRRAFLLGQVVHHVLQHALADGAQTAGARAVLHRFVSDGFQGFRLERQHGILELEHLGVLLHQSVLRLGEDAHEIFLGKLVERRHHGDAPHELGDHAVLVQILRQHARQKLGLGVLLALGQLGVEAQALLAHAVGDDVGKPDKRAAQDEQDVRGVDMEPVGPRSMMLLFASSTSPSTASAPRLMRL